MEFLGKKRKGTDVIPTSRNNLKSLTFILSHLSLEDYSRQRKKYKEEIVIETVASCKSVVNGAVTAPPFVGICSNPPSRGLKREIGCIDAATRLGRKKKIEQEYDLGAMIGKGKFGLLVLCRSKASGQQFACKTLRKGDEIVHREVEIMQHLSGHPGVVTLKAVYEDTESFYLVMELCSGGRLLDQMTRGKRDLSENELVGPIPPILGNLSYTGKLYLHGNKLTGPIPPELGNMSKLSYFQLNGNQLVGGIPVELGKLEQLFELNLANNNLEGPIPHNISSCTALNQFNVYGNRLSGSIPRGFQSLESLTYLNLSSNHFKGSIPVELGRIINLDTLDLSSNNFLGPVPAAIGDLEHLVTLNLSHNHLNGPIPSEFGILRSIQIIDMPFNNLSGHIPEELGQLQNIASLILNNNNLRGEIPDQLTNCLSLVTLDCYDKLVSFLLYWFRISVPKYLWILLDALRSRF